MPFTFFDSYDQIEATTANEEFLKLIKKSAEQTGRNMVKIMVAKFQPNYEQLQEDVGAGGENQITDKENKEESIIERKNVTKIRLFLAQRYPRLDNPLNVILPYCRPETLPAEYETTGTYYSEYDHEY